MESSNSANEPTIRESKSALLEAAQAAIADQRTKASAAVNPLLGSSGGRGWFQTLLIALILTGGTVLALQPGWLSGPPLPKESDAIRAASATLSLVEAVSHIRAFAASTGRLPAQLKDAGVVNPAISLRPLDGSEFEVSLRAGASTISLKSTDSLKSLVVGAIKTLQGRT